MNETNKNPSNSTPSIIPRTIPVGSSVLLMDIDEAMRFFPNQSHTRLLKIFQSLRIPLIYDRGRVSFNLYTLERVLHYITRPGGPGMALIGSTYRDITRFRRRSSETIEDNVLMEIGDKEIDEMYSPVVESDRLSAGPRSSSAARIAYIDALKENNQKEKKTVSP